MHRQVHVQVDEAGRQDAIVARDDGRPLGRLDWVIRDLPDEAVTDQHVSRTELGVDPVEDPDILDQYRLGLGDDCVQQEEQSNKRARHAVLHLVIVMRAANTIVIGWLKHDLRGVHA